MTPEQVKFRRATATEARTHIAHRDRPNPRTLRRAQRALRLYWARWVAVDMQRNPNRYAFPAT